MGVMVQTMWIFILKGFIQQHIGTCQEKTARIGCWDSNSVTPNLSPSDGIM